MSFINFCLCFVIKKRFIECLYRHPRFAQFLHKLARNAGDHRDHHSGQKCRGIMQGIIGIIDAAGIIGIIILARNAGIERGNHAGDHRDHRRGKW